jgi:hypothetical protein
MIPLLLLSLVMATCVFFSNWLFEQPVFWALATQVGAGILVYSGLCLVFQRAHLKETWEIFRGTTG